MSLHDRLRRALLHPEEPKFELAILFSLHFFLPGVSRWRLHFLCECFFSAFFLFFVFLFFYAFVFFSIENADSRIDGLNIVAF